MSTNLTDALSGVEPILNYGSKHYERDMCILQTTYFTICNFYVACNNLVFYDVEKCA